MEHGTTHFGSVDWASEGHAACIVDAEGTALDEFEVAHSHAGLIELCHRFRRAGVQRVAIERPDGPVVDALMAADLEVVVVSTRAVKALRTRYGLAGNKADRSDAFVLADCLRTDGHRWPSLQPDQSQTVALRAAVRTRKDLVATRGRPHHGTRQPRSRGRAFRGSSPDRAPSIRRRRYEGAAYRSLATCLPQPFAGGDASGATTGPMTVSTRAQSFG
jgi:hypothetical protein